MMGKFIDIFLVLVCIFFILSFINISLIDRTKLYSTVEARVVNKYEIDDGNNTRYYITFSYDNTEFDLEYRYTTYYTININDIVTLTKIDYCINGIVKETYYNN